MRAARLIALLLLQALSGFAGAASETVAVLDFTVPAAESTRWGWAEGGVADLLQIQLQQSGLELLDRDLIHAVLAEQRLAASGATAKDYLALSQLLNARYLVPGRVTPLEGGRFRVEASAFSVEAIETVVVATGEGAFPKELPSVLRGLARQLAAKIKTAHSTAGRAGNGTAPKPEALIMFYRGLNACARGQPEWGAAYFMNAASLDPDFSAPLLWEIKAYELAGFSPHAAIRRVETAEALSGFSAEVNGRTHDNQSAKPVIAVLTPIVTGANGALKPAALGAAMTESLLGDGRVRLFAFEHIGDAVAEHDLRLSSFFTRQHALRYGRWLASDALLLSRASVDRSNQVSLDLALVNPLTTATLTRVRRTASLSDLQALARVSVVELLANWTNPAPLGPRASPLEDSAPAPADESELRPVYQGLAKALVQVRRQPEKSDAHRALADAFAATGRTRLAAIEIERGLELLDIQGPKADKTYLGVHLWLFWQPSPASGAVRYVDKKLIDRFIQQLLTTYPQSLAAGCLHYNLAVSDWRDGKWTAAADHATHARAVMKPPQEYGDMDRELLAATYFLEGASLRQLGQADEARSALKRGLEYMSEFKVRDFCLPYGPKIDDSFGTDKVVGLGGDRPGIRTRIEQELAHLNEKPGRPASLDLRRDAEEIVAATNAPTRTREDWLRCAERIAVLLEQAVVGDVEVLNGILASARTSLGEALGKGASADLLRPSVERLVATILAKRQVRSFESATGTSVATLTETAVAVLSVYESAGLKEEGWRVLQPLFTVPYPVELSLNLLLQLNWDAERFAQQFKQTAARVSPGDTNTPAGVWLKLGRLHFQSQLYREALQSYARAIALKVPPLQCPGLRMTLAEVALETKPAHATEEIQRWRRELGLPQVEVSWLEWFCLGRKYQTSRGFDLDKALAAYRNTIEFLENPERGGFYRLDPHPGGRGALSWGTSASEKDSLWERDFESRWYSAAFYLAQCLIELDQKEEAAQWLRRIALKAGGDNIELVEVTTGYVSGLQIVPLGVRAAEMLKELHRELDQPKFGGAAGPYQLPQRGHKAQFAEMPPLPAPDPEILHALTNALVSVAREPRPSFCDPRFQAFVRDHGHDAVPALLSLLPRAGELWDEASLAWMLEQTVTAADTPWLVPACRLHWKLIALAQKLDPAATAKVLAMEWRAQTGQRFAPHLLTTEIVRARVRTLYALVLEEISEKRINHHTDVFIMDEAVRADNFADLTAAFRDALSRCLKLKLQAGDHYELSRISKIALRHGVPEAIDGLLVSEGEAPAKLRQILSPVLNLPASDDETMTLLRANTSRWEWDAAQNRFRSTVAGTLEPTPGVTRNPSP